MTPRTRNGQFAKKKPRLSPADQALHDACREVVAAIRLGRKIGRDVPTVNLARRLEIAAQEWARESA